MDPLDVDSIRNGVLRVVCDSTYREGLVLAGYENVKRFSAGTIAARYADVYRKLLVG